MYKKALDQVISYLITLNQTNRVTTIPNPQLLMLYDGLGMFAGRKLRITDPNFIEMSVERVTDPSRQWSVK